LRCGRRFPVCRRLCCSFLSSLAEANRIPFDIPEAESELIAGITTEYTGMKFGLFYMAEYIHTVIASAVASVLFLGGWDGPFYPGLHWMVIKTLLLFASIYWVRWSLLRFRTGSADDAVLEVAGAGESPAGDGRRAVCEGGRRSLMGHFIDSIRAIGTTLRNFLRPPVTVEYPTVIRPRPERHRVSFALLIDETGDEACIGCLACERICPSQVIAIKQAPKRESKVTGKKRGYADDFTLDLEACIFCELCVQVCPTDAIVMCREPEVPGFCREDLVLTMDKLYANQKDKALSWGTAGKLLEMQDPARGKAEAKPADGGEDKSAEAGAEKPKAKGLKGQSRQTCS
jgi:formate hydrogenlyase subunit 6/NADH:ubiquinone oxidoreductase subunit I